MRLPPRRDIYDLTCPGIPRCRLGFRRFGFQHPESTHFDAVPFDQLFPHRREKAVGHGVCHVSLNPGRFGDLVRQVFLRNRFGQIVHSLDRAITRWDSTRYELGIYSTPMSRVKKERPIDEHLPRPAWAEISLWGTGKADPGALTWTGLA